MLKEFKYKEIQAALYREKDIWPYPGFTLGRVGNVFFLMALLELMDRSNMDTVTLDFGMTSTASGRVSECMVQLNEPFVYLNQFGYQGPSASAFGLRQDEEKREVFILWGDNNGDSLSSLKEIKVVREEALDLKNPGECFIDLIGGEYNSDG